MSRVFVRVFTGGDSRKLLKRQPGLGGEDADRNIAELANDWIGHLPNFEGHKRGGYQVWTGYHSYAEPGTRERIADEIVTMFEELAK